MQIPPQTTILAVDDSPDNLFLLESLLSEEDHYQLQFAEDGKAALELVRHSPPDMILLDVMMPSVSGYEVVRQIRQDLTLPYIPILLITAHEKSSLVEGLDAGADDFLRKPFDVNELLARVRSMARLKRSIDGYRHLINQRDDFMTRLTHDLRTPLIAAERVLAMCIDETFGPVADEAKTVLADVVKNNVDLLAMTNTLLEVHRHDAGEKQLVRSPVKLRSLCGEVVQELAPLAAEKGLALELEVDEKARTTIRGDRIELRRLITNLVGNAIKFTDSGRVTVRLRSPAQGKIEISVEDTGPGISQADQRQIFEWFRQGNHRRAGSGLGLHLAQRIAKLHGGRITVASTLGEGSTFTVTLPAS
ncbi:MAG: hybrid sensor histidine kinase/response regulator [Cyanobacteria bacterium P01_A01_bin.135]